MSISVVDSIASVSKEEWDACAMGSGEYNPFLSHAFLQILEESGSACREEGWAPQHVLARDDSGALMGCVPMYLKGHSYGEYVFDNSWAQAYQNTGNQYYPKLQSCVPFTPVTGSRLLIADGPYRGEIRSALASALTQVADAVGVSSLHVTFNTEEEWEEMRERGFLARTGVQFHWENHDYKSFDDFLMELKQSKRKNIRQERKKVAAAGIVVKKLRGAEIERRHWDAFYGFYLDTTSRKWGQAYLTEEFFTLLGERMAEDVLLVVAEEAETGAVVAGALNLIGSAALYGRNWGCEKRYKNLHFELCYYAAIEAAIEWGLPRVEAGAQGEHKIQRGYLPSKTYSSHFIRNPGFAGAVDEFLEKEREGIDNAIDKLMEQSPFKEGLLEARDFF